MEVNIFDYPVYLWVYCIFVAFITGMVFGSFGNAWAYRIVHGERIEKGRSHCPYCGHTLSALDLIPLVSYMLLKGRCRYCGGRISLRYPIAELCCGLAFAGTVIRFGLSARSLLLCALALLYLVLSLADWESMIIPDFLVIAAGLVSIATYALTGSSAVLQETGSRDTEAFAPAVGLRSIVSRAAEAFSPAAGLQAIGIRVAEAFALAGGLLLIVLIADRVLKKDTMGGGDIKLVFTVGLASGLVGGVLSIFLACIIGLLFAVLPGAAGRENEDAKAFPFGPAICIASYLVLLYGQAFILWYTGLL